MRPVPVFRGWEKEIQLKFRFWIVCLKRGMAAQALRTSFWVFDAAAGADLTGWNFLSAFSAPDTAACLLWNRSLCQLIERADVVVKQVRKIFSDCRFPLCSPDVF